MLMPVSLKDGDEYLDILGIGITNDVFAIDLLVTFARSTAKCLKMDIVKCS